MCSAVTGAELPVADGAVRVSLKRLDYAIVAFRPEASGGGDL